MHEIRHGSDLLCVCTEAKQVTSNMLRCRRMLLGPADIPTVEDCATVHIKESSVICIAVVEVS